MPLQVSHLKNSMVLISHLVCHLISHDSGNNVVGNNLTILTPVFWTQRHQYPTHGHNNNSSLLSNTTTPSWPWTLDISWLQLTQQWFLPWKCATFWSILMHLRLFILHAPFSLSPPRTRQPSNRTQTPQKPKHQHYPLQQTPGTHSQHGNHPSPWNIVYDLAKDEILTWTNKRIQIYQCRGRRQFVYWKKKHENTFPRTALPIRGHWQASYFIVERIDHWTNASMAIPTAHHCKTQWQYTDNDSSTNKGLRTHHNIETKGNTTIPAPSSSFPGLDLSGINKSPHGNRYHNGNNGTLGSNGHKGTTKHHSTHGTSKDSHMSNKWQPQV
jgi:hypothetical protein